MYSTAITTERFAIKQMLFGVILNYLIKVLFFKIRDS